MRRKKQSGASIKSQVSSPVVPGAMSRQFREKTTRVGIITSPIRGKTTNAKQWSRWTP